MVGPEATSFYETERTTHTRNKEAGQKKNQKKNLNILAFGGGEMFQLQRRKSAPSPQHECPKEKRDAGGGGGTLKSPLRPLCAPLVLGRRLILGAVIERLTRKTDLDFPLVSLDCEIDFPKAIAESFLGTNSYRGSRVRQMNFADIFGCCCPSSGARKGF